MSEEVTQNTRTLKAIVIGLAVLIVIALGALVIGLVMQAKKANEAVMDNTAPMPPLEAVQVYESVLPTGAIILDAQPSEKYLVIRYQVPGAASPAVAVVHLKTGRLLYRIAP